jgi:uncharacterized protein YecE (DUF72 family)
MIRIGTSGYNYPEWRGSFYPEKFPTGKMLPYYAERFGTVEINYTFYRMPNAKTVAGWDAETPAGFSFTLKAPDRLGRLLDLLPAGLRSAFEFRHASWFDAGVYARLRAANAALCLADTERETTPLEATADWGYLRLRDQGYTEADLQEWGRTIERLAAGWRDAFVYFKHEEAGTGPAFARRLREILER